MKFIAVFLLSWFIFARPAQAYLDPGTGSYILQLLIGGIFGLSLFVRNYWSKISLFLTKKSKKPDEK